MAPAVVRASVLEDADRLAAVTGIAAIGRAACLTGVAAGHGRERRNEQGRRSQHALDSFTARASDTPRFQPLHLGRRGRPPLALGSQFVPTGVHSFVGSFVGSVASQGMRHVAQAVTDVAGPCRYRCTRSGPVILLDAIATLAALGGARVAGKSRPRRDDAFSSPFARDGSSKASSSRRRVQRAPTGAKIPGVEGRA